MNAQTDIKAAQNADRDWWRGAVIYQIYPRSFQDSDGDGVGDLKGITSRLDHVASLGVDAIWISPFFTSPMLDFGYDVSDYRAVDPLFGTLADYDALVARAHELGLKVMIDLVLSHSSDQHPWFAESRVSRDNPKSDWYVWADPRPDGTPPNNWLSIFGGPAWEWDGVRQQYYLHNFLKEQPDLNLHNRDVQDALLDVARFWLDRGTDGFRLDTINFYFHDQQLRDNPPLAAEDRNDSIAPAVNPYNWQDHLYDKSQPENLAFLLRFRALLDEYPAATAVGEVGDAQRGTDIQIEYTSGDDRVHMCYAFDFLTNDVGTGRFYADNISAFEAKVGDGWACWAFSNHDVMRHASRLGLGPEGCKVNAAVLLSMRGSVCLYQGEELGLQEAELDFEDLRDPYGIRFWPEFKGRDGCRTPMPWQRDNQNGGFSEAKPWLPVPPAHLEKAVTLQDGDPGSTLAFYRRMLAFRAEHPAFAKGTIEIVSAGETTLVLTRAHAGNRVLCAFNLSDAPQDIILPSGNWRTAPNAPFDAPASEGTKLTLPPYHAYFGLESGA